MINDIKLGFQLIRYAHGLKGNLVCGILFLIFGVIFMVLSDKVSVMGGNAGFLIMIIGMLPAQLIQSLNVTSWVQSAPVRKKLQTKVPVFCSFVAMAIIFVLVSLFRGIVACLKPHMLPAICSELVVIAFLGGVVMLYMATAYKRFWSSTLLFLVTYMITFSFMNEGAFRFNIFGQNPGYLLLALALGMAILAVAAFLSYCLSLLLYKLPISKMAQPTTLRKYL